MAEIDFDPVNQNQFIIFNGQKEDKDETIKEVQLYIEEYSEQKPGVDALAKLIAISIRINLQNENQIYILLSTLHIAKLL